VSAAASIRLVALREMRERLHGRAYLVSTGVLIVLLGVGLALPKVISAPSTIYRFGVAGASPAGLEAALGRAAATHDATVEVRHYPNPRAATAGLDKQDVGALLAASGRRIVFRRSVDDEMVTIVRQAFGMLALPGRLARHGLTAADFQQLVAPPPVHVRTLQGDSGVSDRTARLVAMGGASLMLLAISMYGSWVMAGVAQEKTGRVAELLVAAIAPRHLLAGKVIGIGALGLAQVVIVAAVVGVATAIGVTELPSSFVAGAALVVPWFVLGFALYAVGFAVAGAVVTRQEDAATVSIPVTGVMVISFFISYGSLQSTPDGVLAQVATVFPTTAPFMIPGRSAMTGVPAWEHALALVLMIATLYGLVRLGGRLYTAALLHTSPLAGLPGVLHLRRG
jgi:ABC-2 type transport system permease protein